MVLINIQGCTSKLYINSDKVDKIEKECNKLRVRKFKKLNGCEKIEYLYKTKLSIFKMTNENFIDLLLVMNQETGIYPSLVFGTFGGIYPSDTLFDYDLKRWITSLGCDSIIRIKGINDSGQK